MFSRTINSDRSVMNGNFWIKKKGERQRNTTHLWLPTFLPKPMRAISAEFSSEHVTFLANTISIEIG